MRPVGGCRAPRTWHGGGAGACGGHGGSRDTGGRGGTALRLQGHLQGRRCATGDAVDGLSRTSGPRPRCPDSVVAGDVVARSRAGQPRVDAAPRRFPQIEWNPVRTQSLLEPKVSNRRRDAAAAVPTPPPAPPRRRRRGRVRTRYGAGRQGTPQPRLAGGVYVTNPWAAGPQRGRPLIRSAAAAVRLPPAPPPAGVAVALRRERGGMDGLGVSQDPQRWPPRMPPGAPRCRRARQQLPGAGVEGGRRFSAETDPL